MNRVVDYIRELYQSGTRGWDRFWFAPAAPETFCLIRIFTGLMLLYSHLVWSMDLLGFFGADGRLPREFVQGFQASSFAWSYLFGLGPRALWVVHLIGAAILVALTLGFWTRVTSVLAFIVAVSYAHRATGSLFGLDQINAFLAMYLMVGPAGECYSLDRILKLRRLASNANTSSKASLSSKASKTLATHGVVADTTPRSLVSTNLAIRLIQIHLCIVYFFAATGKLAGASWWDGMALWLSFANYEYQTMDMTWLAKFPLAINAMSQFTVIWELSYCVLIWPRLTRPLVLALAVPLHLGIAFCMGMITFGLIMLVANMAFVSPDLIRSLIDGLSGGEGQGGTTRSKAKEFSAAGKA